MKAQVNVNGESNLHCQVLKIAIMAKSDGVWRKLPAYPGSELRLTLVSTYNKSPLGIIKVDDEADRSTFLQIRRISFIYGRKKTKISDSYREG